MRWPRCNSLEEWCLEQKRRYEEFVMLRQAAQEKRMNEMNEPKKEVVIDGVTYVSKEVVERDYERKTPEPAEFRMEGISFNYNGRKLDISAADCEGTLYLYPEGLESIGHRFVTTGKQFNPKATTKKIGDDLTVEDVRFKFESNFGYGGVSKTVEISVSDVRKTRVVFNKESLLQISRLFKEQADEISS